MIANIDGPLRLELRHQGRNLGTSQPPRTGGLFMSFTLAVFEPTPIYARRSPDFTPRVPTIC
jgi:hypothetical protein